MLAATLSPTYGIYSGYEHFENVPLKEGSEEYLDSEKYEVKRRELDGPLLPEIARINRIRRENEALQHLDNIQFLTTENDALIAYAKRTGDNIIIVVVTLEPEILSNDLSSKAGKREILAYNEIPHVLVQAILAIEDRRFFEHSGVDINGLARAFIRNVSDERMGQGGSTITQQLIKNTYLTPEKTFRRKYAEAMLSLALEAAGHEVEALALRDRADQIHDRLDASAHVERRAGVWRAPPAGLGCSLRCPWKWIDPIRAGTASLCTEPRKSRPSPHTTGPENASTSSEDASTPSTSFFVPASASP